MYESDINMKKETAVNILAGLHDSSTSQQDSFNENKPRNRIINVEDEPIDDSEELTE